MEILTAKQAREMMPSNYVYTDDQVNTYIRDYVEPEIRKSAQGDGMGTSIPVLKGIVQQVATVLCNRGYKVRLEPGQARLSIQWC